MNNYRIEFLFPQTFVSARHDLQAESYNNFSKLAEKYYPIVKHIKELASDFNIYCMWHFYEPHVEITWLNNDEYINNKLFDVIEKYLQSIGIDDYRRKYPKDGDFADWFCKSNAEREFGAKRHALCSEFVDLYNEYKIVVDEGKGLRKQVERTIHTLCNPLGIDYKTEAKLCFSRGLICLLFCYLSFDNAVWVYRKIFRQEY